ncbi:MAG: molybdopterin-binding protein, partial [Dehalococcoidia bacterium]|nr:molybdopterin-binding protein [Dehalococcoidia bacterium]
MSDAGARGEREDTAGPAVASLLAGAGFEVVERTLLPDEPEEIAALLRRWADTDDLAVAVTTGGTGLSPRDRTPQ